MDIVGNDLGCVKFRDTGGLCAKMNADNDSGELVSHGRDRAGRVRAGERERL